MKTLGKLLLVKEMIIQLVVCYYYKMIAVDFSKQQALDADPKAIQQINFTANVERGIRFYLILEKSKGTVFKFSQETVKIL